MKCTAGFLSLYGKPFMPSERICSAFEWTLLMPFWGKQYDLANIRKVICDLDVFSCCNAS